MRWISTLGVVLACAACQSAPGPQVAQLPNETQPACHDFTMPVKTGGRPEQATGQACEQPDGSWQVAQNTPGLPPQTYILPPPGQQPVAAATTVAQPPSSQPPPNQVSPNQPPCSSYTASVIVGGQPQQAVIAACPQPDGSWKITQNTPGLPTQEYDIPPPASSPYPYTYPYPLDYAYPEFFPYWVGDPWFFGLGPSIVVVNRFHFFHHGFGHGFGHGFVRGFGPGFGHGFAAGHGGGGGGHR
jgi:surface antigen